MPRAAIPRLLVAIGGFALLLGAIDVWNVVRLMEVQGMQPVLMLGLFADLLGPGLYAVVVGAGAMLLHRITTSLETGAWRRR